MNLRAWIFEAAGNTWQEIGNRLDIWGATRTQRTWVKEHLLTNLYNTRPSWFADEHEALDAAVVHMVPNKEDTACERSDLFE